MSLLQLVSPDRCVNCAGTDDLLCAECGRRLRSQIVDGRLDGDLPITYRALHVGAARQVMLAAKRTGDRRLLRLLADLLAGAVRSIEEVRSTDGGRGPGGILLVPVPSGPTTRGRNFGDFPRLLARQLASRHPELRLSVDPLLTRNRRTGTQKGLTRAQREANAAGRWRVAAVAAKSAPPVVVVDDVVTTGATVEQAAVALRAAGYRVLGAATVNHRSIQRAGE